MLSQKVLDQLRKPYNSKSSYEVAARNRLYRKAALQLGAPYKGNGRREGGTSTKDHNNLINRLDREYPGWRGYPNPPVGHAQVA